jgi:hypothetical protein
MRGATLIGHAMKYVNTRRQLSKLLKSWNDNDCGDPPDGVEDWATRPLPDEAVERSRDIGSELLFDGGSAYFLYRLIRLTPSLIPVLWPTLPVNVVTP